MSPYDSCLYQRRSLLLTTVPTYLTTSAPQLDSQATQGAIKFGSKPGPEDFLTLTEGDDVVLLKAEKNHAWWLGKNEQVAIESFARQPILRSYASLHACMSDGPKVTEACAQTSALKTSPVTDRDA